MTSDDFDLHLGHKRGKRPDDGQQRGSENHCATGDCANRQRHLDDDVAIRLDHADTFDLPLGREPIDTSNQFVATDMYLFRLGGLVRMLVALHSFLGGCFLEIVL